MAVSRYVTLRAIKHSGSDFAAGTPIALSDEYAAPLLAIGAIQAQAGEMPAMPEVIGSVVREAIDTAGGSKIRSVLEVSDRGFGFSSSLGGEIKIARELYSLKYPIVLSPPGAFTNNSGAFQLATGLNSIPNGNVLGGGNAMVYFSGGNGGLAEGLYAATFSSTSSGQIVGNPATTVGSWTQTLAVKTVLHIPLPAMCMGKNGLLELDVSTSNNGNVNKKRVQAGIDAATGLLLWDNTSALSSQNHIEIQNRGAYNQNVCSAREGQYGGMGSITNNSNIDFSTERDLQISLQLWAAGDIQVLEMARVRVTRGA